VQASCHPLDLRDGTVRIPLAGRTVSLRVADGSPTRR